MKVCIVLSTRPEIIKLSPFINLLKKNREDFYLINTNQHSLKKMSKVFFDFFKIKDKIYNLKPSKKSQHTFLAQSINMISKILKSNRPDYLIVQGDTNTSLAGCLAASFINRSFSDKKKIKIAHIESGLRSFDDTMPEEINRKIIDRISNILFVPTKFDFNNLKKENCLKKKQVYILGNTITDVLKKYLPLSSKSQILNALKIKKKNFFLVTIHRPESVDNIKNLLKLNEIFESIIKKYDFQIIFPIHPRTKNMLNRYKINLNKNIKITEPLEYLDFLKLIKDTKLLLTDSGGLQEEASIIGTPCITLRTTTERQITIIKKVNFLGGYSKPKVMKAVDHFLNKKIKKINDFGSGKVTDKIYKILKFNKLKF
jgi:UDP-N-acetylglucosamine 2-epimerase (non-hydrolysing)